MKAINFFLFILLPFSFGSSAYAQQSITGKIFKERTKEPIPFATVYVLNTKNSAAADSAGFFILKLNENDLNDTLLITAVGFERVKLALRNSRSLSKIYLKEDLKTLSEVNINNKRKELGLGNFGTDNFIFYANWGVEIAKKFEMPNMFEYLKEIIISREIQYFFPKSPQTKFRVKIYDQNPDTKGPGKNICMDTIEVNDFNNDQIHIDVAKYNISIHNSPFFVAIETLPIPYNERYSQYIARKVIDGITKVITIYSVCYQPSLQTTRSKKMEEGWLLLLRPGSVWEKQIYVPAIKIVVN